MGRAPAQYNLFDSLDKLPRFVLRNDETLSISEDFDHTEQTIRRHAIVRRSKTLVVQRQICGTCPRNKGLRICGFQSS